MGLLWEIMEKKMEPTIMGYMGGCQNYGPFLGTLNIRCRIIIGTPTGTIIVNASARPPRLAGLPTVGTCNYRYAGI